MPDLERGDKPKRNIDLSKLSIVLSIADGSFGVIMCDG